MSENKPLDQHMAQIDETRKSVLKWKAIQAEGNIKFAQGTLYVIICLSLFTIYRSWDYLTTMDLYLEGGLLLIYLICAIAAYRYPVIALAVALSVFLLLEILTFIAAPSMIFNGIIWRGVMLMGLSIGLFNAIKGNRIQKELAQCDL